MAALSTDTGAASLDFDEVEEDEEEDAGDGMDANAYIISLDDMADMLR